MTINTIHTEYDGDTPKAQIQVAIEPQYDEAFIHPLWASDVSVENPIDLKYYTASDELKLNIFEQMYRDRPNEWRELEAEAIAAMREKEDAE